MTQARLAAARSLIAVDVAGDNDYLATLPATRHLGIARDGRALVWLDDNVESRPLDEPRPDRSPEVELHGEGAMHPALLSHPRIEHYEAFFDGLGDPEAAPLGWWYARVWLKAA